MDLTLDELDLLKDENALRQKINEIFAFFKEKDIAVEMQQFPYPMVYEDNKLRFTISVSILGKDDLRETNRKTSPFLDTFKATITNA